MKQNLVSGAWIDVRDPRKLSEELQASIEDAQFGLMEVPGSERFTDAAEAEKIQALTGPQQARLLGREGVAALRELKRATVLAYVQAWSFGEVSRAVLLSAPHTDVEEMSEIVGKIIKATGGAHLNTEVDPDVNSPTVPSSD